MSHGLTCTAHHDLLKIPSYPLHLSGFLDARGGGYGCPLSGFKHGIHLGQLTDFDPQGEGFWQNSCKAG